MKLKKTDCLFLILLGLQSCKPSQSNIGEGNIMVREGNVTIYSPQLNINYSYTDIVNGIKSANLIVDALQTKVDSLTNLEAKITNDKNIKPEEVNKKLIELNKVKQDINRKIDSAKRIDSAWQGVGFTNDEYREKTDMVNKLFSKLSVLDFEAFVGLKNGDFASAAGFFGNPTKDTDTQLAYVYQGKTSLVIDFFRTNGKIFKISIYGKEGHDFVSNKGVDDNKHKLLGLKRYKITEYLGKPMYSKKSSIEYCFNIKLKRTNDSIYDCEYGGKLIFGFSGDNVCSSISIHWKDINE